MLKKLLIIGFCIFALGCRGKTGQVGVGGTPGSSCSAISVPGGVMVSCTDGTSHLVPNGATGNSGADGSNGHSAVVGLTAASTLQCPSGGQVITAATDSNDNGVLDSGDSNIQAAVICNGVAGPQGDPGFSPTFTPTIAIFPCGQSSATYKEALLGLTGGGVYGFFVGNVSDPTKSANIVLPLGSYYDTDTSLCNFSISADVSGNITVAWNGSSNDGHATYSPGQANYTASTKVWTVTY